MAKLTLPFQKQYCHLSSHCSIMISGTEQLYIQGSRVSVTSGDNLVTEDRKSHFRVAFTKNFIPWGIVQRNLTNILSFSKIWGAHIVSVCACVSVCV